jgi:adenylate cyclase
VNPDVPEPPDTGFAEFLKELGADSALVEDAIKTGNAERMAGDLVLARGAGMTVAELAQAVGVNEAKVASLLRDLGIVPVKEDRRFGERDVEFIRTLISGSELELEGTELLRVIGASLGTVADAAVAMYVQTVEYRIGGTPVGSLERARDLAQTVDFALRVGDSVLGPVLAQHLRDAITRQRATQEGVSDRIVARMAIGFVDLVGSTQLANQISSRDLLDRIASFEGRAFDVASECGGRIVKHVGDEVMFVALTSDVACRVALSMTEQFNASGVQPRSGIAFGEVITHHGDYYGPVVNLASRLTDHAVPGEILVDPLVRANSEAEDIEFEPAGRRQLKGFDEPVTVFSLSRAVYPSSFETPPTTIPS